MPANAGCSISLDYGVVVRRLIRLVLNAPKEEPAVNDVGCIRTTVRQICMRDIAFSSLRISLVIGTVLNLINQGGYWLHGESLHMGQLILNYIVPFCVAAYSAIRTRLKDIGTAENINEIC